jgi:ATP-binding cassette subfamily B protein
MRAGLRSFRVLMAFSFRAAPWQAALFLLSGAVMSLLGPATAYGAKLLVDAAAGAGLQKGLAAATVLAACGALGLLNGLYYIDLLYSVAEKAGAEVDRQLIELTARVPGLEHHERPAYLDRLQLLREERASLAWMTNALAGLVRVAVQLVASGVLLARLHPALLLLPLVGVVSFLAGRKGQDLEQAASEATTEPERLRQHLFETATAAATGKEVRVFGLADDLVGRHHAVSEALIRVRDRAAWQAAGLQAIDALVSAAAYAGAIGLVLLRAVQGEATPGDVVLAIGLAAGMNAIVFTAVAYGTSFLRVLRTAGRYLWLADYAQAARPVVADPAPVPSRLAEGIVLQNATFRYPDTEVAVLDGVSLHLPAGAVVALVGENGAGKTTLVKLLCRFYESSGGTITVDGVDLRRLDVESWRTRVAAAFQDFAHFELLARETVGVGDLPRLADGAAVAAALGRAGAGDLPAQLPRRLETQLGRDWEGGVELSGGQWQKLALARAAMREWPLLLILDEPTAALDAQAEHALFEHYARTAREATAEAGTVTILVSHRFSTVRMADLIVVLEDRCVREAGSHEVLMAAGGLYAELYGLQARAYR